MRWIVGGHGLVVGTGGVTASWYTSGVACEWVPPDYEAQIWRNQVRLVRRGRRGAKGLRTASFTIWDTENECEIDIEVEIRGGAVPIDKRRGDAGMSPRSAVNMRRTFESLPWERLGRPALISLTYPGNWKRWVPDGRRLEAHRTALRRRWVRRWREPLAGVWVKEFQQRGAPHLHLYVALPSAMSEEEMERLRRRAIEAKGLEHVYGTYQGRGMLRWGHWEGEFIPWLRDAWSEVVGTQGRTRTHHGRGVDVRVFFFTEAEEHSANRQEVARYLGKEAAKWQQKQPPEGFTGVGRYWGWWPGDVDFVPDVQKVSLDWRVGVELGHRMERWVRWRMRATGASLEQFKLRKPGDGVTAYALSGADFLRVLRWSERAVERKIERRGRWTFRGGGPSVGGGDPVRSSVDKATGALVGAWPRS